MAPELYFKIFSLKNIKGLWSDIKIISNFSSQWCRITKISPSQPKVSLIRRPKVVSDPFPSFSSPWPCLYSLPWGTFRSWGQCRYDGGYPRWWWWTRPWAWSVQILEVCGGSLDVVSEPAVNFNKTFFLLHHEWLQHNKLQHWTLKQDKEWVLWRISSSWLEVCRRKSPCLALLWPRLN